MSLISIVTLNQFEGKKIFETLSEIDTDKYRLEFDFLRPMQLPAKLDPNIDLLVYNNHAGLHPDLHMQFTRWRKAGFQSSILLISKINDTSLIGPIEQIPNCVLLEKPFEDKDLCGISEKLLKPLRVAQRRFRRYSTNQRVEVTSYKTDFQSQSRVNNISMGGLCLEGEIKTLQVGDLLKINFSLDKLNVQRAISGKVVWVQEGDQPSAGVQFIKDEELYGHILRDIG